MAQFLRSLPLLLAVTPATAWALDAQERVRSVGRYARGQNREAPNVVLLAVVALAGLTVIVLVAWSLHARQSRRPSRGRSRGAAPTGRLVDRRVKG